MSEESAYDAKFYDLFRRPPPQTLITKIINYVRENLPSPLGNAVDVGCGTGQSTEVLSPYFKKVTGCDSSETQIEQAKASRMKENLEYFVSPAEELPLQDETVDLLFCMTAFHWFKQKEFLNEAKRILIPGGVIAIAGQKKYIPVTDDPCKNQEFEIFYDKIFENFLKPFSSPEAEIFFKEYESINFPFDDLQRTSGIQEIFAGTAADYTGYISSTSSYQKMKTTNPDAARNLKDFIQQSIAQILGESVEDLEHVPLNYSSSCFLILGRKPFAN